MRYPENRDRATGAVMKSRDEKRAASATRVRPRRVRMRRRAAPNHVRADARETRKAFQRRYPDIPVDPALFRLVGVDAPLHRDASHEAIGEVVADWFAEK